MWTGVFTLADSSEIKFRANADWAINWGSDDGFPTGIGVQDGPNLMAPPGSYHVIFNCATGDYSFYATCGDIGIVGAFSEWGGLPDAPLHRDMLNPDMFAGVFTLVDSSEIKFRANADWAVNWGSPDGFPTGVGVQDGPNLMAPPGSYHVIFNCATGAYSFLATCGDVSMIGAFIDWNGDVPMNRDMMNPHLWTLTKSWSLDSEVKFRQNRDWAVNWGSDTWPTGTATDNGPNIPLVAGQYDVSFDCSTGDYSFVDNNTVCGDIGMIGDFNAWGEADANGFPTDAFLVRDPNHPSQFSLNYTFNSATNLLFRMNGDETFTDVWGGVFPFGTGVQDGGVTQFSVPGGNYLITFNCLSGDFNFVRLGSSMNAPKVFALNVDGALTEKDWKVTELVSNTVSGANADLNTVHFGAAYNDTYFYVGINVVDAELLATDAIAIGFDGNNSGGDYDDGDAAFAVAASGVVISTHGPDPLAAVTPTATGYQVEVAIAWADLGVTPETGTQVKIDVINNDEDSDGTTILSWNGDGVSGPSSFGGVNLQPLSCGDISLFGDQIGDVNLQPLTDDASTYVGTYDLEGDMDLVFRKDNDNTVTWGSTDFPTGAATVGGDMIPATSGRYRVSFGCLDGAFSFTSEPADATVAYAQFESTAPTIDGNLSEYDLDYGMDADVVVGPGSNNNTVTWGASWDENNLYLAAQIIDDVVEGSGNPWDNDAIEWYIDGNHDSDGPYDGDFDTQIIMDIVTTADGSVWTKADGAPIDPLLGDIEGKWLDTDDGYNVELRLSWSALGFEAGRGRTIGYTIGNNDSDNGIGRDYQTAWVGTGDNWNNTGLHGDLQLAGGDLFYSGLSEIFYNDAMELFPNPVSANDGFNVVSDNELFNGDININMYNMMGQKISGQVLGFTTNSVQHISTTGMTSGSYIVQFITKDGKVAVKKIIVE